MTRSKIEESYNSTLPKDLGGLWKGETYLNTDARAKPYGIKKYFSFHKALNVFNARTFATRTGTQFLNMLLERIIRLEGAPTTAISVLCIITSRIHKNHALCATGLFHTEQTTAPEETSYELEQRAIRTTLFLWYC